MTGQQAACALHKAHYPEPFTIEYHHVIPVAQQLSWAPAIAPYPGEDPDGRGLLWDDRTIPVAPTCHRNVHFWIVKFMHALTGEDPQQAWKAAHGSTGGQQAVWGLEALTRFKAAGGSLQQLVDAREWGES